ncbi:MAG TPA: twin-arginine translocase TatA/TatE family subunit [Bacteroidia bacterium]|nr:twin-arginine translocase TatA/TatE family subunit [Bacteroidia bacterium]
MQRIYLGIGLGMQEMIVIFLIVLLLFGAKKIPELARGIGKGMGEFKKAKTEFEREINMGEEEGKREWERGTDERKTAEAKRHDSGTED